MTSSRTNPFPATDADRHAIWDLLVERDIVAFLSSDWNLTGSDFLDDGFVGHSGPANPDHWRISFPSLQSYRDSWEKQAKDFQTLRLKDRDKAEFLFDATVLRDIEINGDHALAHKKFDGRAKAEDGSAVILNWQTLYRLRRIDGQWKLSGFLGYLPNPMPGGPESTEDIGIHLPIGAKQHKTAGPYSPVLKVKADKLIVISGQGPIDDNGAIVGETFAEQTHLTLQNCIRQLRTGGATPSDVFKVTVYLKDLQQWAAFNEIYREYFVAPYPARTAIQAVLWGGIQVEIDMLAASR